MAEPQMVDPHDPVMTGENSFIRLSNDGGKTIVERVSHWRVLWSPAGQGHALFIESSLLKEIHLYSDNAGMARYLQRTIETLLYKEFADESLPIVASASPRRAAAWRGPRPGRNRKNRGQSPISRKGTPDRLHVNTQVTATYLGVGGQV